MKLVKRRDLLLAVAAAPLAGCTVTGAGERSVGVVGGESAHYAIDNFGGFRVEAALGTSIRGRVAYRALAEPYRGNIQLLLAGIDPAFLFVASSGHKIPDEVEVSWREPPLPGGHMYSGPRQGPYVVPVRSRIPGDVLRQVRTDDKVLCISFGIGGETVLLNWAVVEYDGQVRFARDRKVLRHGGDSFR